MKLTATVVREEDWLVAQCLEVDVASQGKTVEEAVANLEEALALYFEGEENPQVGASPMLVPVEVDLSGKAG